MEFWGEQSHSAPLVPKAPGAQKCPFSRGIWLGRSRPSPGRAAMGRHPMEQGTPLGLARGSLVDMHAITGLHLHNIAKVSHHSPQDDRQYAIRALKVRQEVNIGVHLASHCLIFV